uniref:HTH CENPB-type domain-containing protein n=1 Tax=Euplotes harpa TaxID=151035 RepID=A0A7S3J575_9SPIT|mmetsp:Transcript_17659/g.20418  ORF Transcript_17659/g.20418 Transcript_17659/m.20418 type:complete len:191 (+) Transcript_17659:465-1037(+)
MNLNKNCVKQPTKKVTSNVKAIRIDEAAEEKKCSSQSVPSSADEDKLQKLIQYLQKTKGVNKNQIDENLLAKTAELGQQKVSELLNIPYRRYKSILGKAGVKSPAGRKIQNSKFETNLVNWAHLVKSSSKILTRKMLKDKAEQIIKELISQGDRSLKKVRLSKGWLDKFVKRHDEIKGYLTSQKGKKGQN